MKWEIWEFCSAPAYNPRQGVMSIRTYPNEQAAREDCPKLFNRESERLARYRAENGHPDPFPRSYSVREGTPASNEEIAKAIDAASVSGAYETYSAYISQVDPYRVVIRADGTGNRRIRAAEVSGLKRAIEKRHWCTLVRSHTNYSETSGFLSRTEVWYKYGAK
jgi:hypothetical protein